jgi:hydrogenase expression/formation protein HypC
MCLGIPGKITSIEDQEKLIVKVDFNGVQRNINMNCIVKSSGELKSMLNKWVLVHVGFAMSCIDEDEAKKTLEVLNEMEDLQSQMYNLH